MSVGQSDRTSVSACESDRISVSACESDRISVSACEPDRTMLLDEIHKNMPELAYWKYVSLSLKPVEWIGSSLDDLREFPEEVQQVVGYPVFLTN